MLPLNLRQKMIGCFCLHLFFYIIVGITLLKDFDLFQEDVILLMHAGNLSNICLEIRRYEKNYIIRQDMEDFNKVLEYIGEAEKVVPQVLRDLMIMPHPEHLQHFSGNLQSYKKIFLGFEEKCSSKPAIEDCNYSETIRNLGQELVNSTEALVTFAQRRMNNFIEKFKVQLVKAAGFLTLLSIFTIALLYKAIIIPLKLVESSAIQIAEGTFTQLPVDEKKGEVRSVLRAFNKMVLDLEEKQEQLFQAKKLSSIGTLASGTAHQINNPLNNIATSCQLALAELDTEHNSFVAKMLDTINQETQRAGEIVRGLLEFSRVQTFSLQPYPLFKIVNTVKQLVASEIPAGTTLKTDIPEDIILSVDVQKMVEALLNLTINALQAISDSFGTVFIHAVKDTDNNNAVITISDTGSGIDKDHIQKIFDPFFTTKNAANGTGLGLAVVYGIIKKHSGTTEVESEKGKGTRFILTLPLQRQPDKTDSLDTK